MRRRALLAVPAVLLVACSFTEPAPQLPDLDLAGLREEDDEVTLSDLDGPTVINLWASWCDPCRREMPVLEEFHQRHGDRVAVLGIDYLDPRREEALRLARSTGVSYQLVVDPDGDLNGGSGIGTIKGLPLVLLVDADGRVQHRRFGEITDVDQLEDLVTEHLDVSLAAA